MDNEIDMKIDLNLFVVFDAIYCEGNITKAASVLNLSQPAVSHSLGKLRTYFDDPLFIISWGAKTKEKERAKAEEDGTEEDGPIHKVIAGRPRRAKDKRKEEKDTRRGRKQEAKKAEEKGMGEQATEEQATEEQATEEPKGTERPKTAGPVENLDTFHVTARKTPIKENEKEKENPLHPFCVPVVKKKSSSFCPLLARYLAKCCQVESSLAEGITT